MRDQTDITIILDRSGSMGSCQAAIEESLNGYIKDQQNMAGECVFSLVQFDYSFAQPDGIIRSYNAVPIKDVGKVSLSPRGSTALLDAIGDTITKTGQRFSDMNENDRPDTVLITIVTDGGENSSSVFTYTRVKEMIEHQTTRYNWNIMFLSSDLSALADAQNKMGISALNTMAFNSTTSGYGGDKGTKYISRQMSNSTANLRNKSVKTSGGILIGTDTDEADVDAEYAAIFGDKGAIKDKSNIA